MTSEVNHLARPNRSGKCNAAANERKGDLIARRPFLVMSLAALPVAACGGDQQSGTNGDEVNLTLWAGRDYFIPVDNFDLFHREHSNINVSADVTSLDEVFQTLARMRNAGSPLPDIVHTDGQLLPAMWEAGFVREIDDLVEQWEKEDPDLFSMVDDSVWQNGTWDGHLVAMGDTATMDFLFYREDLFNKSGVDVFTSWDELLEALRAVKADNPDLVSFSYPAARGEGHDALLQQMVSMGVEFEGGIPQLQSEGGNYFIHFYQTMAREGLLSPDVLAWTQADARGAFAGGRAAASSDGWGQIDELRSAGMEYGEDYVATPFPVSRHGTTEDGQYSSFNKTWYITADSDHPYEASLVFRYLMEPEIVLAQSANGQVARHRAVFEEGSELYSAIPAMRDFDEALGQSVRVPTAANYPQLAEAFERAFQDLLQNTEESPQSFAKRWGTEFEAL